MRAEAEVRARIVEITNEQRSIGDTASWDILDAKLEELRWMLVKSCPRCGSEMVECDYGLTQGLWWICGNPKCGHEEKAVRE